MNGRAAAKPAGHESPYDWVPRRPVTDAVKRATDLVLASAVLVLLSPLWLAIMVVIRLDSPGPALYRATVVGRGGRPFRYFKFRTMRAGDDSHHRAWIRDFVERDAAYAGGTFKVTGDPRITSPGRMLRRTSVDEIPQLLNVLAGDMSIVGPRPPLLYEFELYDDHARSRLAVRPGLTGLYQVSARSTAPFSRMVELDREYIERRSVRLDAWIMLRTVLVVVRGVGAA